MSVVNEPMEGLTIKAVSERTGVSVYALRAWERRYGVPQPRREPGNRYRLYDENDIADVLWMKRQIESGVSPALASRLLQQQRRPKLAVATTPEQPMAEAQSALQAALLDSDEAAARHVLDEAFAMFTLEQVALQVIQPTMLEIGERWMRNEVTVWQEHFATNIVRQKLLAVLHSQSVPPFSVPYIVSACAPTEEHELGLLIFSLFARRRGWRVAYLGQGTPLASIADLARESKPNVIAVSVTTAVGLTGLIPWLDSANRPNTSLAFGGRLITSVPSLREHLPGTFLGEDASTGVRALGAIDIESSRRFWSPNKRAGNAVRMLQAKRLKIAGDTVTRLLTDVPSRRRSTWGTQELNFATLFLVDVLSCALGFDAPALVDWHRTWLKETLLPRGVMPKLIAMHLKTFARVLTRSLESGDAQQFKLLLARMEEN